ncbi:MAG: hypothetical protein JNK11_18960 [Alphaproteobacteria bacterium]|nr:hypothetical protein [Alphaproteobacteria bacterium]
MATLDPWLSGFGPATSVTIHARKLGMMLLVGTATVARLEPYQLSLKGAYRALGREGEFGLDLALLDGDPRAAEGPCRLGLAGEAALDGRYRVERGLLRLIGALDGRSKAISLEARDGGLLIAGDLPATLLVRPGKP